MVGLGGALLSLWLGLGMSLSALSALPGALGRLSRGLAGRVAPVAMRKVVAFVLGTTLTAALVPGTALAGAGPQAGRPAVVAALAAGTHAENNVAVAAPDVSFRFVDERRPVIDVTDTNAMDAAPPPAWAQRRTGRPGRPGRPTEEVVVLRGDTLWSIAAHHLGTAAGAAEIDTEWRRWFGVNRDVIGADAHLILPGQLQRPPPAPRTQS